MRDRLRALRRLSTVFGMVEEIRSTEVRRAALAVAEAQIAIQAEQERTHEARTGGREALLTDDSAGWSLAIVHEEIAERRRKNLQPLLGQCKKRRDEAHEQHIASRLRNDQMKQLVKGASERVAIEEEKRTQTLTDDRFLSRREQPHKKTR